MVTVRAIVWVERAGPCATRHNGVRITKDDGRSFRVATHNQEHAQELRDALQNAFTDHDCSCEECELDN